MLKKYIYLIFLIFIFLLTSQVQAEEELPTSDIKLIVRGQEITFLYQPLLKDKNTILVPLASTSTTALFKSLGAEVTWNKRYQLLEFSTPTNGNFKLAIDSTTVKLADKKELTIQQAPRLINGVPYLSLNVLCQLLDAYPKLEEAENRIYVNPLIKNIYYDVKDNYSRIRIVSSGPINYTCFNLHDPERLIIDIPNAIIKTAERVSLTESELISEIRSSQFQWKPQVVRVVVSFQYPVEYRFLPRENSNYIDILVKPGQVGKIKKEINEYQQYYTQQKLTDITSYEKGGHYYIKLKMSGPVHFDWHRLKNPDHRFFINFQKTTFALPKQVTTINNPNIESFMVNQFQVDPSQVTRLTINLKKPLALRIFNEGFDIVIDITMNRVLAENDIAYSGIGNISLFSFTRGKTIVIDPGHGGSDPGAVNRETGLQEKNMTLDISLKTANYLRSKGWKVFFTRSSDRDVYGPHCTASQELGARTSCATSYNASIFLSIHINASFNPESNGISNYWYKPIDKPLAREIQKAMVKTLRLKDLGIFQRRFYVLRGTQVPATLVEVCFISNHEEESLLRTNEFRQKAAKSIADGVENYYLKNLKRSVNAKR